MGLRAAALRLRAGSRIGPGVRIGRGARINARDIELGARVSIGAGVVITAERVVIDADSYVGDRCRIVAPQVHLGYNCVLFPEVCLQALTEIRLGAHAKISRGAVVKAGRIGTGVEFWMNRGAEIGGGGWRSAGGRFEAGDRCHVGRNTHINTADAVSLGDDTAVGMDCTIATHAHWQPVTEGFPRSRGPVRLGSDVAVYSRSIISPGVTVCSGGTIAGGSVVLADVPERGLVAGAPARLIRIQPRPATALPLIVEMLDAFVAKRNPHLVDTRDQDRQWRVRLPDEQAELLLIEGHLLRLSVAGPSGGAVCEFDLDTRTLRGDNCALSESLRGHLFSYGLRFAYLGYRRSLLHPADLLASGLED